ncbi:MAG: hypothetical protein LBF68_07720 [Christensenellaceae bacterium]|jgi:hypothetical protein|nr:hypothetical protein [Christensenellaceae bacterium]
MLTNKVVRNLIVGIIMIGSCHASGSDAPTPAPEPSAQAPQDLVLPVITITFPPDTYQTEPPASDAPPSPPEPAAPGSEAPKATYTSILSSQQMEQFVYDCTQQGATITIGSQALTFDQATIILLINTLKHKFPEFQMHVSPELTELKDLSSVLSQVYNAIRDLRSDLRPFFASILWTAFYQFSPANTDTSYICLYLLKTLAPTNFATATLLLHSQIQPQTIPTKLSTTQLRPPYNPQEIYVPKPEADWTILGHAINILQHENNGKKTESQEILRDLKATCKYQPILGTE